MKRVAVMFVFACAICALALPASAQDWRYGTTPAPSGWQESPQTVKAAIPPQGKPAPGPTPGPQERFDPYKGPMGADPVNLRLEVTISYQVGNAAPIKRSATLTVADQGRASLRAGNQVPVPSTTQFQPQPSAKPDGGGSTPAPGIPITSFTYRSVGLNLDASNVAIAGSRARINLGIEFSAVDDKAADSTKAPSFPTFSQNLTVVLESGKPLMIAQTSDVVDNVVRKQSVEVTATILR